MNTSERTLDISKFGYTILQIETKGSCNMACQFCPYPLREDNQSVLNDSDIFHLIDQINPNDKSFEYVCFSQFNEPLLDPRIFDFIKYHEMYSVTAFPTPPYPSIAILLNFLLDFFLNDIRAASPSVLAPYPFMDSRIVATFGDTTTKLAPPRSVN